jgi:hypothetical protein
MLLKYPLWIWQLNIKIEKSMKELSKLNAAWAPAEPDADQEMMTEEERQCFQRIGLKMDSCLVLGNGKLTFSRCVIALCCILCSPYKEVFLVRCLSSKLLINPISKLEMKIYS